PGPAAGGQDLDHGGTRPNQRRRASHNAAAGRRADDGRLSPSVRHGELLCSIARESILSRGAGRLSNRRRRRSLSRPVTAEPIRLFHVPRQLAFYSNPANTLAIGSLFWLSSRRKATSIVNLLGFSAGATSRQLSGTDTVAK